MKLTSKSLDRYSRNKEILEKWRNKIFIKTLKITDGGIEYGPFEYDLKKILKDISPKYHDAYVLYFVNQYMNGANLPNPNTVRISTLEKWGKAKELIDMNGSPKRIEKIYPLNKGDLIELLNENSYSHTAEDLVDEINKKYHDKYCIEYAGKKGKNDIAIGFVR